MQDLNKNIGTYYFTEAGTENFSTEYILEIFEEDIKIRFKLEMIINGNFGKNGKTWIGLCIDRNDFISMIAEIETDWTYTVIDNKKTENSNYIFEVLPLEIYRKNDNLILNIITINKRINLIKQ